MSIQKLELEHERKKLIAGISRAETAKLEIDARLVECELQMERAKDHSVKQDEQIVKLKEMLANVETKLSEI